MKKSFHYYSLLAFLFFLPAIILLIPILFKNQSNLAIRATSQNGLTACTYDWFNNNVGSSTDFPNFDQHFSDSGLAGYLYYHHYDICVDECEGNASSIISSNQIDGASCQQICSDLNLDIDPHDANCGNNVITQLMSMGCDDLEYCQYDENTLAVDYVNTYTKNCLNTNEFGTSCASGSSPIVNLNQNCISNCGSTELSDEICYGFCSRWSPNSCNLLCQERNYSEESCDDICNFDEVVLGATPTPTPEITPANLISRPDFTTYCSNHEGIASTVDHDVSNWDGCYDWCNSNWDSSQPLCQFNGGSRDCWLNYPPDGGVNNCTWEEGANGANLLEIGATPTISGTSTLLAHWALEDNNSITEENSNFLPGTIIGNSSDIAQVSGSTNNALSFTNNSKILVFDNHQLLNFSGSNTKFYIEASVKSSDFSSLNYRRIVYKQSANNDEVWFLGTGFNGGPYCAIMTTSGYHDVDSNSPLPNDHWNKIACSWDGNTGQLKIYLDDTLINTNNLGESDRTIVSSVGPIGFNSNPDSSYPFNGQIDEVKIYNDIPDNSEPSVTIDNNLSGSTLSLTSDSFVFTGTASDDSGIEKVRALVGGSWQDCACTSNCDTTEINFSCTLNNLNSGEIRVQAIDKFSSPNYTTNDSQPFFNLITNFQPEDKIIVNVPLIGNESIGDTRHSLINKQTIGSLQNDDLISSNDAVYFNGNSKIIFDDIGSNIDFDGSNSSFTIQAWVKPDSDLGDGDRFIAWKSANQNNTSSLWEFGITNDHHLFAKVNGEYSYSTDTSVPDSLLEANTWSLVKMSWDGPNKILSIRVNSRNSVVSIGSATNNISSSNYPFVLGGEYSSNSKNWKGGISNLVIKNEGDSSAPYISISSDYPNRQRIATTTPTFNIDFTDSNQIISASYFISYYVYDEDIGTRDWQSISLPDDGEWDSNHESFTLTVDDLTPYLPENLQSSGDTDKSWYLLIRATDILGNTSYFQGGWFMSYLPSTKSGMAAYKFATENFDLTPPDIFAHTILPNRTTDKYPHIRGYVRDYVILNQGEKSSNISSIQYRLNNGEWQQAEALDGSFNSPSEEFNIRLNNLSPGEYSFEIKATDTSNNTTSEGTNGQDHPNFSGSFSVVDEISTSNYEPIVNEVNFTTRDLQDPIYTTAIWGNGIARLKQTMDFSATQKLSRDNGDFGYEYGDSNMNLKPATDGNLWIVSNSDKIIYFDIETNTATDYPKTIFKSDTGQKPNDLYEFAIGNDRYLVVSYPNNSSSVICHLNQNPHEIIESSDCIDYGANIPDGENRGYVKFSVFGIDSRISNHTGLYGSLHNDYAGADTSFAYIDTHDNPMDISNYTIRYWGKSDGIDRPGHLNSSGDPGDPVNSDAIAFFFNQNQGEIVISTYSHGTFICNDGGTPTSTENSSCLRPQAELEPSYISNAFYSIDVDSQNRYIFGGNRGVFMFDPLNKTSTDDDLFITLVDYENINFESVSKVKWVEGEYPVGDEIFYVTRSGHLRVIETNNSPEDYKDDTNYDYELPLPATRQGNAPSWHMTDNDTSWQLSQGRGLYQIDITRSFEDQNIIEFMPTPPEGMLEINNITLSEVNGSVSTNSSHSFSDLVSYEVSNDYGLTWLPISVGQTVKFPQPGYKFKVRITLNKGSTPILDYVKLNYYAYPNETIRLQVENSLNNSSPQQSNPSNSSTPNSSCTQQPPISTPKLLSATSAGKGKIKIFFTDSYGDYTHYSLSYGTKPGSQEYGALNIGPKGTREYIIDSLFPGRTYYVRVRADNNCNATPWSNEIKIRAPILDKITFLRTSPNYGVSLDKESSNISEPTAPPLEHEKIPADRITKADLPAKPNILQRIINVLKSLFKHK